MTTDTTELGLERLICTALAGHTFEPAKGSGTPAQTVGGAGWTGADPLTTTATSSWTAFSWPSLYGQRSRRSLRRCVEGHEHAIRLKAEIMVDHFHEQVLAKGKISGEAGAMVVTSGINVAIRYFHALRDYLKEHKSPHRAIVAFFR